MRKHIDEAVSKDLKCSDIKYGFAEYKCETCGESTKVPFTCKSKFCNRCGILYTMKWAEKKGRTKSEVDDIICWLTGYNKKELEEQLKKQIDYETFFREAPLLNPSRTLIKGVVCGVRVEDIKEPTMQEIRYLNKLIDELAKGKSMEKIFR